MPKAYSKFPKKSKKEMAKILELMVQLRGRLDFGYKKLSEEELDQYLNLFKSFLDTELLPLQINKKEAQSLKNFYSKQLAKALEPTNSIPFPDLDYKSFINLHNQKQENKVVLDEQQDRLIFKSLRSILKDSNVDLSRKVPYRGDIDD